MAVQGHGLGHGAAGGADRDLRRLEHLQQAGLSHHSSHSVR
ncbi:hypothetical protein SBRY_11010 [Actinacidiphila bryophytorum]|uniref:Uncharacterized protein n=1 Tax=Actinacidiphila bryophytorum TaxID=1436133 RepID=A0A9W4GXQ7_9ACTN|nr:hypothetical protein SBRY_11010 [Actinacidiphila bryophytorum]